VARLHAREPAELARRRRQEITERAQDGAGVLGRVLTLDGEHRSHPMQPELELRHDAEVGAAPLDPPEEVRVLVVGRSYDVAARRDDLCGEEVVARQTVQPGQPPVPTAEGEAADACVVHHPTGRREPVGVGGAVQIPEESAPADTRSSALRVDLDPVHRLQVDHDAAVRRREARDAVSAPADGDLEALAPGVREGGQDVTRGVAPRDEGRPCVDHHVPQAPGVVVAGISRFEELAAEPVELRAWHGSPDPRMARIHDDAPRRPRSNRAGRRRSPSRKLSAASLVRPPPLRGGSLRACGSGRTPASPSRLLAGARHGGPRRPSGG
jgi:hypothetical protein